MNTKVEQKKEENEDENFICNSLTMKVGMIFVFIINVVLYNMINGDVDIDDFSNYNWKEIYRNLDFSFADENKEYVALMVIILLFSIFLYKGNMSWFNKEINIFMDKEKENEKIKEEKRQEEFERKMKILNFQN